MIDSLLFLPDVVDAHAGEVSAVDLHLRPAPFVAEAPGTSARDDAEAAAAVAATRDGHAHAARGAWDAASAALERSAAMRDGIVDAGLAGPVVAARAWSDVAAVRVAAGDVDGARAAFARVRGATRALTDLPADVGAAIAELDAALGPSMADVAQDNATTTSLLIPTAADAFSDERAGGLLWLDTTEDAPEVEAVAVLPASAAVTPSEPAPAARIAAVDDVVALTHAGRRTDGAPSGLASRLRRLLRR